MMVSLRPAKLRAARYLSFGLRIQSTRRVDARLAHSTMSAVQRNPRVLDPPPGCA